MGDKERKKPGNHTRRPLDVLVILLCLSGAAVSLNLFRIDLFQTINSQNAHPIGTIIIRHNIVQRRMADRVLWDRLFTESPVYAGDLIRVAGFSEAVLSMDYKSIELNENTLIRIQIDKSIPHLELFSGNLTLNAGTEGGKILLVIGGNEVEVGSETVLNAAAKRGGMVLQVTEGNVLIKEGDIKREVTAGTLITLDATGIEQREPAVMVIHPQTNTRYLKSKTEPLDVSFLWNKMYFESNEALLLTIAENRNFTRVVQEVMAFNTAEITFDTGVWYWRLSHNDVVMNSGRITVIDAPGPVLLSPATNQVFHYQHRQPEINFRWSEVEGASYYLLEAGGRPDFLYPQIIRPVEGTSFVNTELGPGTWYWRVKPVFSSVYSGDAGISSVASFRIEQSNSLQAPVQKIPNPGSMVDVSANSGVFHFSWTDNSEAVSHTILVSANEALSNPLINQTVQENFYTFKRNDLQFRPGQYYWGVYYTGVEGNTSHLSQIQSFVAIEERFIQRTIFPPNDYTIAAELLPDTRFTWVSNLPYESRFQVSSRLDFSLMEIDVLASGESFRGGSLPPGNWFWRVYAKDASVDYLEFSTPVRRLNLTQTLTAPVLELPRSGSQVLGNIGRPAEFRWQPVNGAEYYRFHLYSSTDRDQPVYEDNAVDGTTLSLSLDAFAEGTYYWTVQAVAPEGAAVTQQFGPLGTEQFAIRGLRSVRLESPAQREAIEGLRALRQPITFRWSSTERVSRSRLVISRNPNPLQGRAERVILNPGQNVSIGPNTLEPGTWYWTIEAQTTEGHNISAAAPRQLRVLPIPLLPETRGRLPVEGYRFGDQELRANRNIVFSWSDVNGSNAYIFNLYQEVGNGRRYIVRDNIINRTNWTLDDLSVLDHGKFIWQVEAISRNRDGRIEQHGQAGVNSFIVDFTPPGPVQTREAEVFYVE